MLPNSSAQRSYRSDKEPAYRYAAALGRRACPLRHACGVPPLPKGEALAFRIASSIFLPKFMVYLFCGLARPLTPDQQDGVEKNLLLLQKNLFFQTLCRQAGKTALYPECPAAKKLRTTLALPLKSLWVQKKSPPGWASSTNRCRKLWSCFLLYL